MSSISTGKQKVTAPPVPAKPGMSVQGSSGPEPSLDVSVSADSSAFTSQGSSSFNSTDAETFSQPYPMSFTGSPKADDIPLSETHDSDQDFSGSVSDSEDNPLSDSMDKPITRGRVKTPKVEG